MPAEETIFLYVFCLLIAFSLCVFLIPAVRRFARSVGAVDMGAGRRIHAGAVPRLGGAGIFAAFTAAVFLPLAIWQWDAFEERAFAVFLGGASVFLIGAYDDIRGARVWQKLTVEASAAVFVYLAGVRIQTLGNPFGGGLYELGWLGLPATVLWIIVITNAVNLIDGLDGLAALTGLLIALTLFFTGWAEPHHGLMLSALAGGLLGFLIYNYPPASIFMGDSGSLFTGFVLSSLSIMCYGKTAAALTVMAPLLAFGMPLMDMLYAVLRRMYRGMPLGGADREHIHHKLLDMGLSKKKVLAVLFFSNAAIMVFLMVFIWQGPNFHILGLVLFSIAALSGLRLFGYVKFVPIFKEMAKNYEGNKKRRYFNYINKNYRRKMMASGSVEDLKGHIAGLVREYDFNSVKFSMELPGMGRPVIHIQNRPVDGRHVLLDFPILRGKDCLGKISLVKELDGRPIYCTSGVIDALSAGIGGFIERNLTNPGNDFLPPSD